MILSRGQLFNNLTLVKFKLVSKGQIAKHSKHIVMHSLEKKIDFGELDEGQVIIARKLHKTITKME